jgi:signal transduction histidine kinase
MAADDRADRMQQLEHMLLQLPVAMLDIDIATRPARILAADGQTQRIYGCAPSALFRRAIDEIHPTSASRGMRTLVDSVRSGVQCTIESVHVNAKGGEIPVRLHAMPYAEGEAPRMLLLVEDISAEHRLRSEQETIDRERRRIAHDIHDGLAQGLAALRMRASLWPGMIESDPEGLEAEIIVLKNRLRDAIREVRRAIFALRPAVVDEEGFVVALQRLIDQTAAHYGIDARLEVLGPEERLPERFEIPVMRILQETLSNAGRHGAATSVSIELDLREAQAFQLRIQDDGRGFDVAAWQAARADGHYGLIQLRERVSNLQGQLSIDSRLGAGVKIVVSLPIPEAGVKKTESAPEPVELAKSRDTGTDTG